MISQIPNGLTFTSGMKAFRLILFF